jgi:hypothetical protein
MKFCKKLFKIASPKAEKLCRLFSLTNPAQITDIQEYAEYEKRLKASKNDVELPRERTIVIAGIL